MATPSKRRAFVVAALLLLAGVLPARADDLKKELTAVADTLTQYLKDKHANEAVAVGEFGGSTRIPTSSGPAIQKALGELLKERSVRIEDGAGLEVKGEFFSAKDEESGRQAVELKVRVVDRDAGKELVVFNQALLGDAVKGSLVAPVAPLPPAGSPKERDKAFEKGVKAPKPTVKEETKVSTTPKSPYAVEILVKKGTTYVERPIEVKNGLPFVALERNEIYAVRIINNSGYDAVVSLSVDGLNMFAFSKNAAYRSLGKVIVPPGKTLLKGWHLTDDETSQFLATEYAKGAATTLRSNAKIGTIVATFAAAWPENQPPPVDEPQTRAAEATAKGPVVKTKFVPSKRFFGVVRDIVSVRYAK